MSESDFYRREHRLIFAACEALVASGSPADMVSVPEYLERTGKLNDAGGLKYVGDLLNNTSTTANAVHYARIVRQHAQRRELLSAGAEIQDSVFEHDGREVAELVTDAERRISAISERGLRPSSSVRMNTVLRKVIGQIELVKQNGGKVVGLPTGFADLDAKTNGFQSGDLIIVAGRPSSGKTTFAMNIAENVAVRKGAPVHVFSLEMPAEAIGKRSLSSTGRLDFQRLQTGTMNDDEWTQLCKATQQLGEAPLTIDDATDLSPAELRSRARRAHREHGPLALIVVDYLGLMRVPGVRLDNRVAEVTEISRSLKALAKELSVPVLACAQLNRALEQRPNKRPMMSDLRDSGSIEQDADLILFVYREELYDERTNKRGIAEIIIGKQRNGPTGTVYLTAALERMRFENFSGIPPQDCPSRKGRIPDFEYS